jgi:putative nucleotidyltransferase with HDIG domain
MTKMKIPTKEESLEILNKNKTPSNVISHCEAVCKVAEDIADKLIAKGIKVNKNLVIAAALLHDVEREKEDHVDEGAKLLKNIGFPEVAEVISKHSLYRIEETLRQPKTYEEKIVFYADKRCVGNKIVSLKERFEDAKRRYNTDFSKDFEFAKKIEEELVQ